MKMVTINFFGSRDLQIESDRYANNGRLAVFALEAGEPFTTLSVNLPEERMTADEFAFKTYSENEGLFEQFLAAGASRGCDRPAPKQRSLSASPNSPRAVPAKNQLDCRPPPASTTHSEPGAGNRSDCIARAYKFVSQMR